MSVRMGSLDMVSSVKMMSSEPMSKLAATRTNLKESVAESRSDEAGPLLGTKTAGSSTRSRRRYRMSMRMGCVVYMTGVGRRMRRHPSGPSDHQQDASILL